MSGGLLELGMEPWTALEVDFFLPLNHLLLHLYKLMKLSVAFVLHPCRGAGAVPGRGVSSGGRRKGETILGPGMILSKTNLVGPAREGDLW